MKYRMKAWRRAAIATVVFCLLLPVSKEHVSRWALEALILLGKRLGYVYFQSGGYFKDMQGRVFSGPPAWFDWLWSFALGWGTYLPPLLAALLAYHLLSARRPRPDGHTRCGPCGYILKGLREPRCPECGRAI